MKLFFIVCAFWVTTSIEGVPNDYEQQLQPRSFGSIPIIDWFYGNSTEGNEESSTATSFLQHANEPPNPDERKSKEMYPIKNDLIHQTESAEKVSNEVNNLKKSESSKIDDITPPNNGEVKVIPVDKIEPNDKPEPIENLIEDLKQEAKETHDDEENKNISTLLTELNKTMTETPTRLAKVFINNTWRIFDIGIKGTSRRTRNVNEVGSLLTLYYALLNLISQLLGGLNLGGHNLLGNLNLQGSEKVHSGGLMDLLLPSMITSYLGSPSVDQKLVGGIAGLPAGDKKKSSKNVYIICIDDEHKKKANRLFDGKTLDEVLSKIQLLLNKKDLDTEEKFYIVLKLHDLYDRLSEDNDKTKLKLIYLIIAISEDPRFEQLFEIFKSKNDPDFDEIWKLFNEKPKLNENYLSIIRNLPQGEIKEHPSRDCFIIGPNEKTAKLRKQKIDYDSDSDDEETRERKRKSKVGVETYIMKLEGRDPNSQNDYYICCIDDDDEFKANRILSGKTNEDIIDQIKKYLKKDYISPQYKWYIVLKLYIMLKDAEKADKVDKKGDDTRDKIINLIIVVGEDPKFKDVLTGIKTKNDPRFREIRKLLQNEPIEPDEKVKSPIKEKGQKVTPQNSSNISEPKKENVGSRTEPKKDDAIVKKDPPQVHSSQKIVYDQNQLPDISKVDWSSWRSEYDPILQIITERIKNPDLDPRSKWNLIEFLDRWYDKDSIDPGVKSKFDGIVKMIKEDPKFNETFDAIKRDNEPPVTKRVFNIFGKEYQNPPAQQHSSSDNSGPKPSDFNSVPGWRRTHSYFTYRPTTYPQYYWPYNRPDDDGVLAKLPLMEKIDVLINLFTMTYMEPQHDPILEASRQNFKKQADDALAGNRKDFENFENVFLSQLQNKNSAEGNSVDFTIRMLRNFRDYLYSIDYYATGKKYSNGEERRMMQDFIESKKVSGEIAGEPFSKRYT